MPIFWVGFGGFLGAIARYGTFLFFRYLAPTEFPLATIFTNSMGCFFAGFLTFFLEKHAPFHEHLRLLWSVGFLGAYTTYSAFAVETFSLFRSDQMIWMIFSILGHFIFGLLAVWGGYSLGFKLLSL